jgi:hypothetical protein
MIEIDMPRKPGENTTQVAIRVPDSWLERCEALLPLISQLGMSTTRTDILRIALARGIDSLEKEYVARATDSDRYYELGSCGEQDVYEAVYCAAKPVTVTDVARLVEQQDPGIPATHLESAVQYHLNILAAKGAILRGKSGYEKSPLSMRERAAERVADTKIPEHRSAAKTPKK